MTDARTPRSWVPGALVPCPGEVRGCILFRRVLLSNSGRRMCTVFEAVVREESAERYIAEFGAPERCRPPWGKARADAR